MKHWDVMQREGDTMRRAPIRAAVLGAAFMLFSPRAAWASISIGPAECVFPAAIIALLTSVVLTFPLYCSTSGEERKRYYRTRRWLFFILILPCMYPAWILLNLGSSMPPSTQVSVIFNNLRNLTQNILIYASDPSADHGTDLVPHANRLESVLKYQYAPDSYRLEHYFIHAAPRIWWVGYDMRKESNEIRQRLASRTGLFGSPAFDQPPLTTNDERRYTPQDNIVWMPVELTANTGDSALP